MRPGSLRAVTFDGWGSLLFDSDPEATRAARVEIIGRYLAGGAGIREVPAATWDRGGETSRPGGPCNAFELAREILVSQGVDDRDAAVELAVALSDQALAGAIGAVDGARETLAFLRRRGVAIGLVCDTGFATGAVIREILEREGLADAFAVQVYSDEWGATKPDYRLFRAALAGLETPAAQAAHVGTSRGRDVAGARHAGMVTIRIAALDNEATDLPEADLVAESHPALRRAIDRVSPEPSSPVVVGRLVPESLPDDRDRLDRRMREGRLAKPHIRAIAAALSQRHESSRCDDETAFPGTVEKLSTEVRHLVSAVRREGEARAWLGDVESSLAEFVLLRSDRIRTRVLAERVREVHGHLDPTRVSVSDDGDSVRLCEPTRGPFGAAGGDVARDLVDLYGGLRLAGLTSLGERLVADYAELAVDFRLYGVLDFHARLQALRRRAWYAAIAASASDAATRSRATAEVAAAERLLDRTPRAHRISPIVIATGGPVGSGKSSVSRAAAEAVTAPRLEVDRLSAALIDDPLVEPVRPASGWEHEANWERNLAPGFEDAVYAELFGQAQLVLASGRSVVLDGCFGRSRLRETARRLADDHGARLVFLECRLDRAVHRRRLAEREARRGTKAGAWVELAAEFERRFQPITELAGAEHHVVDTAEDEERTRARVAELLERHSAAADSGDT